MNLIITGLYASLLGLLFLLLSIYVIKQRRANVVSLGDGDIDQLQKATRAHGNFSEYVPICLILLAVAEMTSQADIFLHACGILLVYGRSAHAYGLVTKSGPSWGRVSGMLATFACLLGLSLWNLFVVLTKLF
ncbi:MAPEG family protein [Glaciecola sp. MH2013]|uniref:MAPEG family protein n=1 Tax=Glaciecola sp. MH2013 TaxID=2785524 RepID=UPI00189D812E|nr:MAPEG family protein [Glaciecola sp. MH2013]MBF7073297.1 MAPEG family protein [Glaciecola sp. MH2013]